MFHRLLAVLLLICACVAQEPPKFKITSTSPATQSWVPVAVPYLDAMSMPAQCAFVTTDGRAFPAVRGPEVGYSTVFYDVLADLAPNAIVTGDFAMQPAAAKVEASTWVWDDIGRIIPRFTVREGGRTHVAAPAFPLLDFASSVRQDWSLTTRCGPVVLHFFSSIWLGQDVMEWQLLVVNSDPTIPAAQLTFNAIDMTLGEPTILEDAAAVGLTSPSYDAATDSWVTRLVPGASITVADGQCLPVFRGAILCTDSTKRWWENLLSPTPATQQRVARLLARGGGRPVATSNWKDRWMPWQATVPAGPRDSIELQDRWNNVSAPLLFPTGDMFQVRRRGLAKLAGGTGSQDEFGASRGAELTLGDVRHALAWHFNTDEPMRPYHYRESNTAPVLAALHPNWRTWSQVTHYSCSASPDRLSKPCPLPWVSANGWGGKDDQHTGTNTLAASVAMFDWPAHRLLVQDEIRAEQANVRWLPGQPVDAARAVGRRLQANSKRWFLTGSDDVWRMVTRFERMVDEQVWRPVPNFVLHDTPTVDVRVLVDASNAPVPAVVLWQEGLGLLGHAEAWASHRYREKLGLPKLDGTDLIAKQLVDIGSTMVRHYFAQVDGKWIFAGIVKWNGAPPPVEWIARTTPIVGVARDHFGLNDAWFTWVGGGLYYLARADHGLVLPTDVKERLDSIASEWETTVAPTAGIAAREWFAVVQR